MSVVLPHFGGHPNNPGSIYEFNMFAIIEIPESELELLDQYRASGEFEKCDELIQNHINIVEIQSEIQEKMAKFSV